MIESNRYWRYNGKVRGTFIFIIIASSFQSAWASDLAVDFQHQLDFSRGVGAAGCFISGSARVDQSRCVHAKEVLGLAQRLYLDNPETLRSVLEDNLRKIKSPDDYNYGVILLGSLVGGPALLEAMAVPSKTEAQYDLPYKYATQASVRIRTGKCVSEERNYNEICTYQNPTLERMMLLKGEHK